MLIKLVPRAQWFSPRAVNNPILEQLRGIDTLEPVLSEENTENLYRPNTAADCVVLQTMRAGEDILHLRESKKPEVAIWMFSFQTAF